MTLEQAVGAALTLLFLADIFLTVLYARAGTGLLAPHWNRVVWASIRGTAMLAGKRRGTVLSFAGPLIVVSLIGFWALGLTLGAALVIHPELGRAIQPSSGPASTDFVTALMVAGNSLSIVGSGDYSPHTTGTRILFLINSLIGTSVISLVLSYLVQVYSNLRQRNALALTIHVMTDGTGDAAEMLARLIPDGEDSANAVSELANLVEPLAGTKEAHHFYPLLFYFRFEEPLYAVSRFSFVLLDLVTLIETALDQDKYRSLVRSAPVASLKRGAMLLLETLDRNFPNAGQRSGSPDDTQKHRDRYARAAATLAQAGIATREGGSERYAAARAEWESLVRQIAPSLGYSMAQIDQRQDHAGSADETA